MSYDNGGSQIPQWLIYIAILIVANIILIPFGWFVY
jgi:hypothetical protein